MKKISAIIAALGIVAAFVVVGCQKPASAPASSAVTSVTSTAPATDSAPELPQH